jgi:peptidoglycan/xylan/chitin deacetylase (PgdA/CDA1 family)
VNFPRGLALSIGRSRAAALASRAIAPLAGDHRLVVLTYHRIAADRAAARNMAPGLASATVADFEEHLRAVSRQFRVIDLADLLALREGATLDGKQPLLMLTFDDAYRDFLDVAWPVIQRCGVTATMFVTTSLPDAGVPYWWDQLAYSIRATRARELTWGARRLRLVTDRERSFAYRVASSALQEMPTAITERRVAELASILDAGPAPSEMLSWLELRQLRSAGLAIGAHSHAHHRLDRLSAKDLEAELETCGNILARELGARPRAFAYPTGFYDQFVIGAVQRAGFDVSFTTDRGVADRRRLDWYRLPRINVGLASNARLISLQALGLRRRGTPPGNPST